MGLTKEQKRIKAERVIFALKGNRFEVGDLVRVHTPGMSLHDTVAKVEFVSNEFPRDMPWYHLEGINLIAFLNKDLRPVFRTEKERK